MGPTLASRPQPLGFHCCSAAPCRFCVVIKKENYPEQQPAKREGGSSKQIYRQPGHSVYLLPTVVLANLLPCELSFYVRGTAIKGSLRPGKEAVLHAADTSQNMELGEPPPRSPSAGGGGGGCCLMPVLLQESCWRTFLCVRSCSSRPGPRTTWSA